MCDKEENMEVTGGFLFEKNNPLNKSNDIEYFVITTRMCVYIFFCKNYCKMRQNKILESVGSLLRQSIMLLDDFKRANFRNYVFFKPL